MTNPQPPVPRLCECERCGDSCQGPVAFLARYAHHARRRLCVPCHDHLRQWANETKYPFTSLPITTTKETRMASTPSTTEDGT